MMQDLGKFLLALSLLLALSSALNLKATVFAEVFNSSAISPINTGVEFQNGTIRREPLDIWYVWVNASGTELIYYALVSEEVNPPIMNFLGQHFQVEDGADVFVGNTLVLFEVYSDVSGYGIPQANFTSGESEIAYYLEVNSSASLEISPIEKLVENAVPHYRWGLRYGMIDGFLQHADLGSTDAKVMIDHLSLHYDLYVVENVSHVKTSVAVGNMTSLPLYYGQPEVSLGNLGIAVLFSTVTSSSKPHTPYVNGAPYDSTNTSTSATAIGDSQIAVEMIRAYEFLFGNNYSLTRDGNVETYTVKSEAAAVTSVPESFQDRLGWVFGYFERDLNISELFPSAVGFGESLNLNCNVSKLLYRICYPVWDGLTIECDPTYVAYLFSDVVVPEFLPTFFSSCLIGASAFATAIAGKKKQHVTRARGRTCAR